MRSEADQHTQNFKSYVEGLGFKYDELPPEARAKLYIDNTDRIL
jgi:hypothetical protein